MKLFNRMQTNNKLVLQWISGFFITLLVLFSVSFVIPQQQSNQQINQVHAQESLTSAIGSGLGKGIVACLGNLVTQFLIPQAVGKVAGASFLNPLGIPAFTDLGQQISQGQQAFTQFMREGCLDALAFFTAQSVLDKLSQDTLAWVNSGFTRFGQEGNSAFVGDLDGFFAGVSDQAYNRYITQIQQSGPGNPLNGVCEAFQPGVVRSVSNRYFAENTQPSGVQPIPFSSSTEIAASGCEQLTSSIDTGTVEDFVSGDFKQGGWEAFEHTLANPNANPVSAYLEKNQQLKQRVRQASELEGEKLRRGNGYVSAVACPNGNLDPETQQCITGDGQRTEPVVKTPGSIVDKQLNRVVGSGQRQLELADEVNEVVAALVDQLIGKVTGTGASEGPGGVFTQAAQESSYSADLEEYADAGYSGGLEEDFASSTLANQIEQEQNLRSIIEAMPSTNDIDRTRVRAKQCLRNNKLDGPGEIDNTEKLLAKLNSVEESVYPPPEGTRSSQSADQIFEDIEENPEEPIETGTSTESGPNKTSWAANEFDWKRGKIYGNERCDEGEYRLDRINQNQSKGIGSISFSYSNSENKWRGFVCAKDNFDSPFFGNDKIEVELQTFEEFFSRAEYGFGGLDVFQGTTTTPQEGTTTISAQPESLANNYQKYLDPSGYEESKPNNQVKIDWNGADFEWKHYDLFSDSHHLQRLNEGLGGRYQIAGGWRATSKEPNRYGAGRCFEQNKDAISWIVRPSDDVWVKQKCQKDDQGNWQGWHFYNTGVTKPAYQTSTKASDSFGELIERIDTLIGDETYDDVYTAPEFEEDNLKELLHDLRTIDENVGPNGSISDRQEKVDQRYGRMQDRFHTEKDVEVAAGALEELDPTVEGSVTNKLRSIANEHNCELPSNYEPPFGGGEDGDGNNGNSDSPNISTFSVSRTSSNNALVRVSWGTENASQCNSIESSQLSGWNGQQLPVTGNRVYSYQSLEPLNLSLQCESESGKSTTRSITVEELQGELNLNYSSDGVFDSNSISWNHDNLYGFTCDTQAFNQLGEIKPGDVPDNVGIGDSNQFNEWLSSTYTLSGDPSGGSSISGLTPFETNPQCGNINQQCKPTLLVLSCSNQVEATTCTNNGIAGNQCEGFRE
jgi:hypothetical protein